MFDAAAYKRAWNAKNRERILARRREFRALNRDKLRAQGKALYWKDPEKARAKARLRERNYRAKNIEAERAKSRKRYAENRSEILARQKKWLAAHPGYAAAKKKAAKKANPARWLLNKARYRAKKLGLPFDLTVEDIQIPAVCPVLGIPLLMRSGAPGAWDNSPSLDRKVPALGYVKGNVRVISWRANALRRDGTLDEMRKVLRDLEQIFGVP